MGKWTRSESGGLGLFLIWVEFKWEYLYHY